MHGYIGRLLEVDLETNQVHDTMLDQIQCRKYVGGSGLAARLYLDRMGEPPFPEPLDPGNPLIIMTGPIAGISLPGSSRFAVCARSPLTNLWGEASCGGYFAPALKAAGYDGIIIANAAPNPVYLIIEDGHAEIREAGDIWGQDTYWVDDALKDRHGKNARTLSIGLAGENLVRFAAAMQDKGHTAGRTGMGAVMGSKRLKAIVALGKGKAAINDPLPLKEIQSAVHARQCESLYSQTFTAFGSAGSLYVGSMMGDIPLKNWQIGSWDDEAFQALDGTAMSDTILTHNDTCHSCSVACKRRVAVNDGDFLVPEGPGPEYETIGAFGSMTLTSNLKAIAKANELCNRHGMDTISCGTTIAFAIEATERGLLESDLCWGDPSFIVAMVDAIAHRQGLGDLLAEGSQRAAAQIGQADSDMVLTVKGMELPMHNPQAYHGLGLGYATAPRGACHNAANFHLEVGSVFYPELGLEGPFEEKSSQGKAFLSARGQDFAMLENAASLCMFDSVNYSVTQVVQAMASITGFPYTVEEIIQIGERLWQLKHGINLLLGATSQDDRLPGRLLQPLEDGPAAGSVPDMELMLREFYALRDLDARGIPSSERLQSLGLDDLSLRLSKMG
jgi:aldehyde:ferredoxin oxidoreductase